MSSRRVAAKLGLAIAGGFGGGVLIYDRFFLRSSQYRTPTTLAQGRALRAICVLSPDNNSGVKGVVRFRQEHGGPLEVDGKIEGMADGEHGFHVHEFGNLTQGCTTAGAHYNPKGVEHGGPKDKVRHVGDFGNVTSKGGVSMISFKDPVAELSGPYSIIGRALVVHKDTDDLGRGGHSDSKTTGHAGARLACGVIGIDKPEQ